MNNDVETSYALGKFYDKPGIPGKSMAESMNFFGNSM